MSESDPAALLVFLQRGDERARERLLAHYRPMVEGVARGWVGKDSPHLEDFVLEGLLAVDRAFASCDPKYSPDAYLRGAVDLRLQSKHRDLARQLGREGPSLDAPLVGDGETLREELVGGEAQDLGLTLMLSAGLTREQTRALVMASFQQRDEMEVARGIRRSRERARGVLREGIRRLARNVDRPDLRHNKMLVRFSGKVPIRRGRPMEHKDGKTTTFYSNQRTRERLDRLEIETGKNRSQLIEAALEELEAKLKRKRKAA